MDVRTSPRHRDRGQALPVYITVIGALLFLAFAYFAVGQAAATRNGAQTAADSAALAATQDRRDQLRDALLQLFRTGPADQVGPVLDGILPGLADSCDRAGDFAADNRAHTTDCHRVFGPDGYAVSVETDYTVGKSVVPGTENRRAHADATAVLTPLCRWRAAPPPPSSTPTPGPSTSATPTATPTPDPTAGPGPGAGPPGTLECRDRNWTVDPSDLTGFPDPADLFSVHLTS